MVPHVRQEPLGPYRERGVSVVGEPKWKLQQLPIVDIKERKDFQLRQFGLGPALVRTLTRVLESGGAVEAVKVAKIGKALYLVDGFHRLEAHRQAGLETISADVARMSVRDAEGLALLANTKHGKGLSPADRTAILTRYVERGDHWRDDGRFKSAQDIVDDLNGVMSRETVRRKLRVLEVDLQEELKPFMGGWHDEDDDEEDQELLARERMVEAQHLLSRLAALYFSLEDDDQRRLLVAARELLGRLERGERTERELDGPEGVLDI